MKVNKTMIRQAWLIRFGIPVTLRRLRQINNGVTWQLSKCLSDEARRLILGVSK